MSTLKAIKTHCKQSYDKQNLTLVVLSYDFYETRRRLVSYEMTIRVRSSIYHYNNYEVWWVLSVLAVLLWLNTLEFFTYLDIRARLSISDLRLSWDRRTILIRRSSLLAMIPSPGEVSIRMNIIFTPMNHLKQVSQYKWFVSRIETPYRKCRKTFN